MNNCTICQQREEWRTQGIILNHFNVFDLMFGSDVSVDAELKVFGNTYTWSGDKEKWLHGRR